MVYVAGMIWVCAGSHLATDSALIRYRFVSRLFLRGWHFLPVHW
jgi:hypothetical protein